MRTLLIIGAGAEQTPAYLAAKSRGLRVVGTDQDPNAPGLKFADHHIIVSTRDAHSTLAKVLNFTHRDEIDGVMTIANDVPYTVALVGQELGLRVISLESARLVADKVLMKEAFVKANVACPWFRPISTLKELKESIDSSTYKKFVLKPIDGRGARGVLVINESTELNWAFEESRRWGECGRLILEEYIDGVQLSTESFLINGRCFTPGVSERNYAGMERFHPYIIENGGTIPPLLESSTLTLINELIERAALSLGVTEGVVKGDVVLSHSGRPMLIELALRLSGGWFASHQIPAATGVNLIEVAISHALGEEISKDQLKPRWAKATATRYWFPDEGRITAIRGQEALTYIPGVLHYGLFRGVGDFQPPIRSHPDRFGFLIVSAETRALAIERVQEGLSRLQVETVA
jgi:biotin carboxylase